MSESIEPESRAGIGKQSVGDGSAHAMSDYHHRFAQRKFLFDGVELLPEDGRAIRIRIAAGIAVEPNLVIAPEIHIAAQIIQHWHPRHRCVHEAMDEKHDRFVWIVRFKAYDPSGRGVFLWPEETGESKLLGFFPGKLEGICGREVCRKGIDMSVHSHGLRSEGIVHRNDTARTLELRRRGNAIKNVGRAKVLRRLLGGKVSDGNEWRSDSVLLHMVLHI